MNRKHLSPDEREEFDGLMEEAGFDAYGDILPSAQIKANLRSLLADAEQAGRPWARTVQDDALDDGLLKAWKGWNNDQRRMRTIHNDVIVPVRAARGVRRRDPDTGAVYHQQTFWREMTWEDVRQQLDKAGKAIAAEKVTKEIANRLLELRERCEESTGPADACQRLGLDFETYFSGEAVA